MDQESDGYVPRDDSGEQKLSEIHVLIMYLSNSKNPVLVPLIAILLTKVRAVVTVSHRPLQVGIILKL